MSTTAKTSEDFRAELENAMSGLPRPYDQALIYASSLENSTSSEEEEEEEEEIPTAENRKKKAKPEGQKMGAYYQEILADAVSEEDEEVQAITRSLLAYIHELEK